MKIPNQQSFFKASRTAECCSRRIHAPAVSVRNLTTSRHSGPEILLDFLVPSLRYQKKPFATSPNSPLFHQSSEARNTAPYTQRLFSTSPIWRAVVVTANPRKDENGNEMVIDITPRAAKVNLQPASILLLTTSVLIFPPPAPP